MSYLGSIPPGVLNLTIIGVTFQRGWLKALYFAMACAFIELGQAFIALKFSDFLVSNPQIECYIQVLVIPVFLAIGIANLLRKPSRPSPTASNKKSNEYAEPLRQSSFLSGVVLSLANPLAVLFWLFWGTYFHQRGLLLFENIPMLLFSLGAALGSLATLMTYSLLSSMVLSKIGQITRQINPIIGVILITLAAYQVFVAIQKGYFSCLF